MGHRQGGTRLSRGAPDRHEGDDGLTPRWGIVATVKAEAGTILHWAAWHLEAGAHRVHVYLDAANDAAHDALQAHPRCRVVTCDADWWRRRGRRPAKHQVRQAVNATHAYTHRPGVDWLMHLDVDEFLVSDQPVAAHLSSADGDAIRVRPMEQLAGDGTAFKGFVPTGPGRAGIARTLYPTFGAHLKGGFLSHLAGKIFVRTGLPDVALRIHNGFREGAEIASHDLPQDAVALAHCHARSWEDWLAHYRFRHARGSYRAELAPNRPRDQGGLSLHDLFAAIEDSDGEAGLRAFFDEVCADTPALRERLEAHGLLRRADLSLRHGIAQHFPGFDQGRSS